MLSNIIIRGVSLHKANAVSSVLIRNQGINYLFDGIRSFLVVIALELYKIAIPIADLLMGLLNAGVVIITTFYSCRESINDLLEKNPLTRLEMMELYKIPEQVMNIKAIEDLRIKPLGEKIFVAMVLVIDGSLNVKEAHEKTIEVENLIKSKLPGRKLDIMIHVSD
ncbi:MAG: cation transporter dimerization domain-containing protein [Promethearchaeota archaeon]